MNTFPLTCQQETDLFEQCSITKKNNNKKNKKKQTKTFGTGWANIEIFFGVDFYIQTYIISQQIQMFMQNQNPIPKHQKSIF
jgi:hypothetical protein